MTKYRILHNGKDRQAWLEARRLTLGASEAASVCGVSRFGSPTKVFASKTLGDEYYDNDVMRFGRIFETQIAHDFAEVTKRKVKLDGRLIVSKRRPWQSCTLDGVQRKDDRPDPGLLEIKTSLFGWDTGGIPIDYWTQIQHQFAVTGFRWGSAAMFNRTSCELVYQDVEPDDEFIRQLTLRESVFWHKHVLPGIPPPIDDDDDSEATRKALLRLYPQSEEGLTIALGVTAMKARDRRAFAKEKLAYYSSVKDAAENRLKALLKNAERGEFSDGSAFTFKTNKRGARSLLFKEAR